MHTPFNYLIKKLAKFKEKHLTNRASRIARKRWRKAKGDQTLRMDYPLNHNSIVFDLGGYLGDFAHAMHSRYGCTIHLFEPVKKFFDICQERFKEIPNIHCYNFGLAAEDGTYSISNDNDASSLYADLNTCTTSEQVAIRSFTAFSKESSIEYFDLIKINIEGGEYDVLPHIIESGYINNINNLQIQFHDFIPGATEKRDSIRCNLKKSHDESWCFPFVWESWKRK
jgi:FkbM family methyltransferase